MAMMGRSFKEKLLLLLCAILAGAVMPFAIMRFRHEQWPAALLDTSVVCVMLGLFLHVYFTRETRIPGIVLSLIFTVAALGSMYLLGDGQIFWAYPALTAAFFLLKTRYAVLLSAVSLLAIEAMLWNSTPVPTIFTITLTLLTSMLAAYSFALTANRQRSRLRHLATVDPLTGTGNRRAQDEKLDTVNALFRRAQIPGSILILDIDHFKKINDTHGHIVGDDVLVEIADLIRANTRPTETLYRYGGEEFIVIAEQTGLDGAGQLAEKLRQLIEQKTFVSDIRLTTSFGVAELHRSEGRQGWLSRADGALFKAKKEGRNRVVLDAQAEVILLPHVAAVGERR
jgi:diguanylate cyclase (GGDEF)-like protein